LNVRVSAPRTTGEGLWCRHSSAGDLRYLENMQTVRVEIPAELVVAAGLDADNLSAEATRLLALKLYREDKSPWDSASTISSPLLPGGF
jgi:hypothetical protein